MKPSPARLLPLLALLLQLPACGWQTSTNVVPQPVGPYRLAGGDSVRLLTYGEEGLAGEFRVSDEGSISVPLLGRVPATGLTTAELEQAIAARLKERKVLENPAVAAEVTVFRPVFILGEVNKPGEYPYQSGMTVMAAAAVAGGFTYRASESHMAVVRTTNGRTVEGEAELNTKLQPGDVVRILERWF
jgi:polysaccharide export outer membrane protein